MIIGNGLIARAFDSYVADQDVVVFASGVSNSLCREPSEFDREWRLLKDVVNAHPNIKFVYFSTCSIADQDRQNTPYVTHKLEVEEFIKRHCSDYLIIRLPAVIGKSNAATTLPFVFAEKIRQGEEFCVWANAVRYPVDIDDVFKITDAFIKDISLKNKCLNIASYPYKVTEIVSIIERIQRKKANFEVIDKGGSYPLDLEQCYEKCRELAIDIDYFYLEKVFRKYLPTLAQEYTKLPTLPAAVGGKKIRANDKNILFGAPVITESDIQSVNDCLRSRWIGKGALTRQFEQKFAAFKETHDAVAVNSCTAGIHLALLVLGVRDGDEVILPTMTFCATAQAVEYVGASPVFVDCDPSSYNISAALIAPHITEKTSAIIVVHIAGRTVDMGPIMALAKQHSLVVIEDCAHALETRYKDKHVGLIGDAGCFSFYATKSITTGDGGMVVMNDPSKLAKLRLFSNHGMTSDAWARVNSNKTSYQVVSPGFKYNMTDMEASLGLSQFTQIKDKWQRRRDIWYLYHRYLQNLPIILPELPTNDDEMGFHLFSIVLQDKVTIDAVAFMKALKYEMIGTGVHYQPLHSHPYFAAKYKVDKRNYPHANAMESRLFSLPMNTDLTDLDIKKICDVVIQTLAYFSPIEVPQKTKIGISQ
ncbi:aminotransferase class I/II-fold pyridoxal phosphate-dependent enzyme [Glaciecola petra]|uniref:DegT/DnrJ/EryC1/StrS family aminotransferase n=1 Tax=Glaciecola petra TaxID=3075602 RepID=A0ABU2ZQN3_9ALTE|nr:aminotransferase class I/II-fold pyridoxal phosphate-dependent enzyme [Aestuariibacter sp. P117]MDT0593767.1 DegT/DnrJ/EryC1/StrS family aminotransferase [Aestuariibacter sp. P117]